MAFGVLRYGAYIPRLRLPRRVIAAANAWLAASAPARARGERSMCNWDEDAITMAVAAARDALAGEERRSVESLLFASTTFPFIDRLNAAVVAEALNLPEHVTASDVASSQRAAVAALSGALRGRERTVVVAAEKRRSRVGSALELLSGDAAAALLVGDGPAIACLIGGATRTADFVDHYRTIESVYDYQWEERWVRDAGYMTLVPETLRRCLQTAGLSAEAVTHFCLPVTPPRVASSLAAQTGIPERAVRDNLQGVCGDSGAAHPLLMLVEALETARPGDRIVLVGFGQGVDALAFAVTESITRHKPLGVRGHLSRKREELNYGKYLAFNDSVEIERGMRSEVDKLTPLSAFWRNRAAVTAFAGGRCAACGTLQFPASRICVNPECNALDTQQPHSFADARGLVNSYTADRLTYSPDPPACFGMIQFEGGGRAMMDFTDVDADALGVGQEMSMVFRIKDIDAQRGFRRYFWKATPAFNR